MKLMVPMSKNNPVKSVPVRVIKFKETSLYSKIKNVILSINDSVMNHITKEISNEYLLWKRYFLNIVIRNWLGK